MKHTNLKAVPDQPSKQEARQLTKYVRVRSAPGARFVEFDFAINEPSLFVELVMPQQAFEIFCEANAVQFMTDEQMAAVDAEMSKWRYGEETLMANNHDRSNKNN
ncbi:phenol hydroxylase subunit [Neptuniibacter sp. CAU 1671]|uniref:phenol hydroxylase subunit n=1 Tax=Neptuniibacter sp. CAU 1671 TaxID=3032593 RepID=UPI0023DC0564|nr:phenol hydroxylase subunit [Neptuniibacter sp. CAU 1671]MDF2180586.1 phenol hydroxylase subunit [Neptuniibacter sp. CAU 1671]